jgi:UPF0716 family protein affecting phage T7 exclusion
MGIGEAWDQFRRAEPGHRFRDHHERMKARSTAMKIFLVAGGLVLIAGGIVLLVIPGPGLLTIALGLALVASRARWLAAALDRVDARVHHRRAH